jgi:hypothetical protein
MKIFNCLLAVFFLCRHDAFADDGTARRYAALDRDAMTCKYFLLSTKEVQGELKLTADKVKSLESVWLSSSLTNDPAIAEYRRSHKQLLEAAHTDEERAKIREDGNKQYSLLVSRYEAKVLQSILSSAELKRLNELFLQMKGPQAILEDTNTIQLLNLSKDQINSDPGSNNKILSLLRHRYLGLQIQTVRKREPEDVNSEMKCVARVIKEVEKDRDSGILAVLSEQQHHAWDKLCGVPLRIAWEPDYFSAFPFQNTKN